MIQKDFHQERNEDNNILADYGMSRNKAGSDIRTGDWRLISNGNEIPSESYSDQPYVIKTDDGAWLCVITTAAGHEGEKGQHVVVMRSQDQGKTWSALIDVEPADGPEASYAALLKVPGGRIYCFYNHNTDNFRFVKGDNPPYQDGLCSRVDTMGYFVFKYSDDHGLTWSEKRYNIPVRKFEIDRQNPYGGEILYFWNVGKPFINNGSVHISLHKVGGFGHGFMTSSEGVLLKSDNLISEKDPLKITWETLPDGDKGLRTPRGGGPISDEHRFCVLSDGSFFCVYRTVDGHPACSYSRDGGHTWMEPRYMTYANGRKVKHPRAANFAWKCSNGKYLYWFHNHGGRDYEDRNPAWICCGVEEDRPDGRIIHWSQPEILLYDDDTYIRMSYPDYIEDNGKYFFSETQKNIARTHEIDKDFLEKLWNQFETRQIASEGILLNLPQEDGTIPVQVAIPELPAFIGRDSSRADYGTKDLRSGFSLDLWIKFDKFKPNQMIVDNRNEAGQGFCLQTTTKNRVEIVLNDGRTECRWKSEPYMLKEGMDQHIVVTVDGGPKIIMFVINGVLCDGGDYQQFGWGRFSPVMRHVNGAKMLTISNEDMQLKRLILYGRPLMTSEAVGNYNAGLPEEIE